MPVADRPIRVVHVVLSLTMGGLENVVVQLARQATSRVEPRVICLETTGLLAGLLEAQRIPVECVGTPHTSVPARVATLRRRLRELAPDVVHSHNEKAHIHVGLATLGWKTPALVHTRHGRWQVETHAARLANWLAVQRSTFVVGVSADALAVSRLEGARESQLRVIRNGIDVRTFDEARRSRRAGSRRAVSVGRLAPVKDLGTLLRAARIVTDVRRDFRLDIVGDGPSRPELEDLARALDLTASVTFHGERSDPRPFLAEALVFTQSSLSEGISLTLLEAMAAGVPVVATDVGGNPEVVETGRTGLLVPPRQPEALAAAILRLLDTPLLAEAMSHEARARVEREFDVTRMVADYETLYAQAANA